MMTHNHPPQLIALDWGTSSVRVYLLGAGGKVLESRSEPWGIMQVAALATTEGIDREAAFARTFQRLCGVWLQSHPRLAVIASGMVGSQQGWAEAPYLSTPVDLASPGMELTVVPLPEGRVLHLVPGLVRETELPDVMRGEETQVLGALHLQGMPDPADGTARQLLLLPGTHSKWVTVAGATVETFTTSMTGESYALLAEHSILAKLSAPAATFDLAAFERGVRVAYSDDGEAGIMLTAFSARTLVLRGLMEREQVADYLSGLMIGGEIRSVATRFGHELPPRITICGNQNLNVRYRRALELFGVRNIAELPETAPAGLFKIAATAGLLLAPAH